MGMEYSTEGKIFASEKLKNSGYSKGSFIIEAFYIGFDGNRFGPVNKTFQIRKFDGEKDITTLPVYPLSCDPNYKITREALVRRGQAFADLSKPNINAHRKYKGLTLDPNCQEHVESEVIVDFQLAFTAVDVEKPTVSSSSLEGLIDDMFNELDEPHKPYQLLCLDFGCCGNDIVYRDYEIDETERNRFRQQNEGLLDSCEDPETLTDSHKALLPPQAHGFVLRTRKWATLDIDLLDPPVYDGGWQNLVIDEDIKSMVLALVENHERPHGSQLTIDNALPSVDLVQGKGRGLIILLHGEPGVGKTSTAECVASHTKRPLFPITCGDIGEKATDVEDHLEKNFQLAHKWGCVLLLDEADVFLGKRGTNDIQRNAVVSVFLRTLEYYSGILFLTTNRVGKIDRAFKSRIHISLFYSKLDLDRTVKIWENNLKRVREDVEKEGMKIRCRNEDIINFAKDHFPIAIAKYEAKDRNQRQGRPNEPLSLDLSEKQFKEVSTITERFDQYLNELHGKNEADLARKGEAKAQKETME
ncbi:hypothetical protein N0V95_002642 [Ascochyta clinopodiicola]|nr:hypothetical protein N0V95_002642 [Ascochyta clinopodiicola]